jgi:tRNA U38,U39,U40 pseudouridine synthase TruA
MDILPAETRSGWTVFSAEIVNISFVPRSWCGERKYNYLPASFANSFTTRS